MKKQEIDKQFEFFSRMIRWLDSCITRSGHLHHALGLLAKMFRILKTRGKPEAIKFAKRSRLDLLKVLERFTFQQLVFGNQMIRFPKDLKFLKRVPSDKFYPVIRLVLSVYSSFRFLRGDGTPSFKSIQEGPLYKGNPLEIEGLVVPFLKALGFNPKYLGWRVKHLDFTSFRLTTKAGPNGHALWSSYLDLLALPSDLRKSIGIVGGTRLVDAMSNYLVFLPYLVNYLRTRSGETGTALRKLAVIRDKEGKNREIAILDYYSQAALQPLHKYLFKLLSRIPQDCTFDQSKALNSITPSQGSQFHSIDLSSATDRFPIDLQVLLLTTLFGEEYAKHWKIVMVGTPFSYQDREISYVRGNPMGAYSSWSSFALAHHFLVFVACNRASVSWKKCPYMLLGDDIVIANDNVAQAYRDILQELDIPFSAEKSHSSPYLFEFAKRFIHQGTEISPFPIAGLYENRSHWLLAIGTIFEEVHRKQWNLSVDVSQLCLEYLEFLGWNSRFIRKRQSKIELILLVRSYFAGIIPVAHAVSHAALMVSGKQFQETVDSATYFLSGQVVLPALKELFRKDLQRITDPSRGKPLGQLAEDIVMIGSELFGIVEDPFLLIHSCPITRCYGEVEEIYLKLRNNPYNDQALVEGKLKDFLFSGSVPSSDEMFYTRRKDVLVTVSSRLADEILNTLKKIKDKPWILHPMAY